MAFPPALSRLIDALRTGDLAVACGQLTDDAVLTVGNAGRVELALKGKGEIGAALERLTRRYSERAAAVRDAAESADSTWLLLMGSVRLEGQPRTFTLEGTVRARGGLLAELDVQGYLLS